MKSLKKMLRRLGKLNKVSKLSIWLGFYLMICFYIVAITAYLIAPYANYFRAMTLYRGGLEAAPASLAVGVCAGLLGDLMLVSKKPGDKPSDEDK